MDATGDEISNLSGSSENSREATAQSTGTSGVSTPQPVAEDSRCRKSSRIKAKLTKQAQDSSSAESGDAYNLRLSSLVKRVQVERRQSTPKQPKGKSKPPPLSKYRRRTANARERMRMKDINEGYERLRQCLPDMQEPPSQGGKKKEVPTKFTILSLALNYIHALRDILGYAPMEGVSGTAVSCGEESDLGSDAASTRTTSVSSASCDELCSNPSPTPAGASPPSATVTSTTVSELKELSLPEAPFLSSVLHNDFSITSKHLGRCHDPLPGSSTMMDFRAEARSSPSSSVSDMSLSPSPHPLPLPEDCMDLDQLDVSISLAELDGIEDIVM